MKRSLVSQPALVALAMVLPCGAQITPFPWAPIGPRGDVGVLNTQGRVRSIQIIPFASPAGGGFEVFVGASGGGLWRAIGSVGPVWTSIGDGLGNPSVGAFAVNPANPDDILVGTGDSVTSRYIGDGFYHTADGGLTWTKVPLVAFQLCFDILYPDPANTNLILAATDTGLLRSTNGVNGPWENRLPGSVTALVPHPSDPSILYAAREYSGVWRTTDSGQSWDYISPSDPAFTPAYMGHAALAICRSAPNNLVFTYESLNNQNTVSNVWVTTSGGTNWSAVAVPSNPFPPGQAFHALALAIKPDDRSHLFLGANGFWESLNGGQSWFTNVSSIDRHQDYLRLVFSPLTGDNVLWMCNDGGVFEWTLTDTQSVSWNGPANALTALPIMQSLDMDALLEFRVIGNQDDGAAASLTDGGDWGSYDSCCDVIDVTIATNSPSPRTYWYLSSSDDIQGNVVSETIPGPGVSVTDPTSPLRRLFYNRFDDRVYSLNTNNALVSRVASLASGPAPWTVVANLPPGTSGLSGDRLNGQTLFAWGSALGLTVLKNVGGSWFVATNAPIGLGIQRVFASTERLGESWALMPNRILHTLDQWQTWDDVSGDLASISFDATFEDIVVEPFFPDVMFVSTYSGIFATEDGGAHWQPFQTGLPIVQGSRLRFVTDYNHSGVNRLVAATFGRSVYERQIPRPPLVCVDQRHGGYQDGSFEFPLNTFSAGLSTTPAGGMMALDGATVYTTSGFLNQPMKITAYEYPAYLTH